MSVLCYIIYMRQNKNITKEQIVETYTNSDLSQIQAARILGCGRSKLIALMQKFSIPTKRKTRKIEGSITKWPELSNKDWLIEQLKTKSYGDIAKMLGTTRGNVGDRVRRFGLSSDQRTATMRGIKKKYPNGRFGKEAANWKGGRIITNHGNVGTENKCYVYIYSPNHPNKTKDNYVMEHRLIMEDKLGRFLDKKEIVHHIDGDKLNNSPENLELHTRESHLMEHKKAIQIIKDLKARIIELEST